MTVTETVAEASRSLTAPPGPAGSPVRSVDAVGISVFGGHEDVANARLQFENGTVAELTASRASPYASRQMQLWGAEGYAEVDFAQRKLTMVQPSEQVRRHVSPDVEEAGFLD